MTSRWADLPPEDFDTARPLRLFDLAKPAPDPDPYGTMDLLEESDDQPDADDR